MKTDLLHTSKAALFLQAFSCHVSQFSLGEGRELACSTKAACALMYREKVLGHSTISRTKTGGLRKKRKQTPTPKPLLKPLFLLLKESHSFRENGVLSLVQEAAITQLQEQSTAEIL